MSVWNIEDILVHEDNYANEMDEKILPYLKEREETLTLTDTQGGKLYCVHYSTAQPRGAVVISAGFTETTAKYAEMAYYFLKDDYAVFIYDHCGHGKSYRLSEDKDKVHIDKYERYTDGLLTAAHAAKDRYPHLALYLFAHSMGAGIAAASAAEEPQLFSKIVLSSAMIRPATGNFPWPLTRLVCALFVHIGKKTDYAPGQRPYTAEYAFESCACVSEARYAYYQRIRKNDPLAHMNGATYGWLHSAVKMSVFIQKKGWKRISAPVLLFQAENESFVVNEQQDIFINKLKKRVSAELVRVSETKHEIYRSHDGTMEEYLRKISEFLETQDQ